jgi:hypothetical protein
LNKAPRLILGLVSSTEVRGNRVRGHPSTNKEHKSHKVKQSKDRAELPFCFSELPYCP